MCLLENRGLPNVVITFPQKAVETQFSVVFSCNVYYWANPNTAAPFFSPCFFFNRQMGKLLSMLWPLITGDSGSHTTAPSLEGFAHLAPVLEQLMTGEADQDTWDK